MEIKVYQHEIDYCGVTPFDDCGVTITNNEVMHICNTLKIQHYIEEWDYDYDSQELILYINALQ